MRIMLKSKIHRATVTDANINYEGSISIDSKLLKAADILPGEKVEIYNVTNGERFSTYTICSEKTGEITLNGAAARKVQIGDIVIIASYAIVSDEEALHLKQKIVKLDSYNNIKK